MSYTDEADQDRGPQPSARMRIARIHEADADLVEDLLRTSKLGIGTCPAHHGEILQGVFEGQDGSLRRGLVTLPCPIFSTTAKFLPTPELDVRVFPGAREKFKAVRAARLALAELGRPEQGGLLFLANDSPEGWGLGSSTSDVVATIRAVSAAFHRMFAVEKVAQLAVAAEIASDSMMFAEPPVLFAHRDGAVLEVFSRPLPPLAVIGFDTDPTHSGVDTLAHPPAMYAPRHIEELSTLRSLLRKAIADGDPRAVGRVATASAKINQSFLPKPRFAELLALAEESHAVGVQVAHSGSVMGLLFDAAAAGTKRNMARALSLLGKHGFPACHRFELHA